MSMVFTMIWEFDILTHLTHRLALGGRNHHPNLQMTERDRAKVICKITQLDLAVWLQSVFLNTEGTSAGMRSEQGMRVKRGHCISLPQAWAGE